MKTIIIDDVFEFDKIGEGAEGEVFKIDDDTVYKYLKHRKTCCIIIYMMFSNI